MKQTKFLAAALMLVVSQFCFADTTARYEAEILMDLVDMKSTLDQTIDQTLELEMKQNPSLTPYQEVMNKFLKKHLGYDVVKSDLIRIYADAFTANELRDINAFYRTETGKKSIRLAPHLFSEGVQIGRQRIQQNVKELQSMIEAEAKRIKLLQAR